MEEQDDLFEKRVEPPKDDNETLECILETPPSYSIAKSSGKPYCNFIVKEKESAPPITVTCFGDAALKARDLKLKSKIWLMGKFENKERRKFIAFRFHDPKHRSLPSGSAYHIIREFGSVDKYRAWIREMVLHRRRAGFVPIIRRQEKPRCYSWEPISKCVFVKGRGWIEGVDAIAEVFGDKETHAEICAILKDASPVGFRNITGGFSQPSGGSWTKTYNEWFTAKLAAARERLSPAEPLFP